jgi:hypothetical protein
MSSLRDAGARRKPLNRTNFCPFDRRLKCTLGYWYLLFFRYGHVDVEGDPHLDVFPSEAACSLAVPAAEKLLDDNKQNRNSYKVAAFK